MSDKAYVHKFKYSRKTKTPPWWVVIYLGTLHSVCDEFQKTRKYKEKCYAIVETQNKVRHVIDS